MLRKATPQDMDALVRFRCDVFGGSPEAAAGWLQHIAGLDNILLVLPEVLRPIGDFRMIVVGGVMFLSILFLPRGLLGETPVLAVLRRQFGSAWDGARQLGWRQ